MPKLRNTSIGFTLAELLIALMILGVIATFTIPKIIISQQTSRFNAVAKENISAISAAFTQAQHLGAVTTNTTLGAITQYLNYVSLDSSSNIDGFTGTGSGTCTSTLICLRMHNGSIILIERMLLSAALPQRMAFGFISIRMVFIVAQRMARGS
ncbi:MAG: hypothetical protein K0Q50_550 [Vampirovibrio sp.]|nr:hypothetical protein [Vampirovibrio sp.]